MRVLVLAPQPFFVDRGTPIAVRLLVRTLSDLGHDVDLLTFHGGRDVELGGARHMRTWPVPGVRDIGPGLSVKKVVSDVAMSVKLLGLLLRRRYDMIHAVEESVFLAVVFGGLFRTPFIYDMDSSIPEQIANRYGISGRLKRLLHRCESFAVRRSVGVAAVCQSLADRATSIDRDKPVALLRDISLLAGSNPAAAEVTDLRRELEVDGPMLLYVGNLEPYQGIDLMLDSFDLVARRETESRLVVIGGAPEDVRVYRERIEALGLASRVHFVGPRPIAHLGAYLAQADILVSPRTQGTNTPMKVYSYLDSGVAVLATRLPTHTQVLDDQFAELAEPEPDQFAEGMLRLIHNPERRDRLGAAARRRVETHHSYEAYRRMLGRFYDELRQGTS